MLNNLQRLICHKTQPTNHPQFPKDQSLTIRCSLVSYLGHLLGVGSYLSAKMQLVYSTAPNNWAVERERERERNWLWNRHILKLSFPLSVFNLTPTAIFLLFFLFLHFIYLTTVYYLKVRVDQIRQDLKPPIIPLPPHKTEPKKNKA